MDLDSLKSSWHNFSVSPEKVDAETREVTSRIARGKVENSQARLVVFYQKAAIFALCVMALSPNITLILHSPVWVAVVYGLYGLAMAIIDFWFARKIKRCNLMSMPVVTALAAVVNIRRLQRQLRAVGMVLGFPVVGILMCYGWSDDDGHSVFLGMIAGFIVGMFIGLRKWRQARKLSQSMQEEIREALRDND